MTVSSVPATVVLGTEEVIMITSASKLGNIYDTSADACLSPTRSSDDSSLVTFNSDEDAVIYSVDGDIV